MGSDSGAIVFVETRAPAPAVPGATGSRVILAQQRNRLFNTLIEFSGAFQRPAGRVTAPNLPERNQRQFQGKLEGPAT